ncbi:hypothetical protein TBLA_0F02660 [Henningerozyma blattae CBS 6284]|uniref:Uncharacterized protein n=1 Tax=Henningerozyma blattae (strain ATCC 34711 / CBS 6284 / DSM 70876 / NBRC 10599 / NRRL Y-10934 / UCD 77-7) TaxID=1071380 RepID=I2H603_HENB6|nr:hypothetical protein TBLA_0F02660 [Tetrapisispora blattae CBS 6284]CCH61805.1 hypothetical protein TBLA_0F02660 [Tetrapisispora blattae CBS 6284]
MNFSLDNPFIAWVYKIIQKPSTVLMGCFTGIIVTTSLYMIIKPVQSSFIDEAEIERLKKKGTPLK